MNEKLGKMRSKHIKEMAPVGPQQWNDPDFGANIQSQDFNL